MYPSPTYLVIYLPSTHTPVYPPPTHSSTHYPYMRPYMVPTHQFTHQGIHLSIHSYIYPPPTHPCAPRLLIHASPIYPSRVFRTESPALLREFSVHSSHYVRPPDLVSGSSAYLCQRNESLRKLHHHHLPPPTSKVSPSEDSRSLTLLGCHGDSPPGPRLAGDLGGGIVSGVACLVS